MLKYHSSSVLRVYLQRMIAFLTANSEINLINITFVSFALNANFACDSETAFP